MAGFCPDEFWNSSTTWNTDTPQFTKCFEHTFLSWLPAVVVVVAAAFQFRHGFNATINFFGRDRVASNNTSGKTGVDVIYTKLSDDNDEDGDKQSSTTATNRRAYGRRPPSSSFWTTLFAWKLLLSLFLISVEVVYVVLAVIWWIGGWSLITGTVVEIVGLATALALTIYHRFQRRHTSGALFCNSLLFLLSHAIKFYDALRSPALSETSTTSAADITFASLLFGGSVLAFIPHMFADTHHHRRNRYGKHEHDCPQIRSSFISRVTFSWMGGLMFRGWRRPLVADDLWTPLTRNRTDFNVNAFEREWAKECKKYSHGSRRKPSVFYAAYRTIRGQFWLGIVFMCFDVCFALCSPQLLKLLMNFVDDPNEYAWKGYFYAATLFCTAILQSLSQNQYLNISYVTGMNLRSAMMAAVYRKALRISNDARRNVSVGEMVNLMSIDAQRILDFMVWPYVMLESPLLIAGATYFLWQELGVATLASLVVMLAIIPVSMTGRWQTRYLLGQMKWKDQRIRIMSEVLSGIKVLKLYAWEQPFIQRIVKLRENEIHYLLKAGYLQATMSFFFHLLPYAASLAGFAAFVLGSPSNILTAQRAFVALTLINIVRPALGMLPAIVTLAIQMQVSLGRLNAFLTSGEIRDDNVVRLPAAAASDKSLSTAEKPQKNDVIAVELQNATLCWTVSPPTDAPSAVKCELADINLQINRGELVAVVGHVGAGKTSLCSALLGLMNRCSGRVEIHGSVAYVPQQPWIQHMTLRDNILFAQDMNRRRYTKVLRACALESDLLLLPAGDGTEIGEKGLNLSGGQKQRVSLARAAYSNSDVIILDDPLSAVDSHVAKHIFHHLLSNKTGLLRNKTRILVTHNVSFLPEVDRIVVLDGGRITESGTYRQLMDKGGAFAEFLRTYVMAASAATEEQQQQTSQQQQSHVRRRPSSPSASRATSITADDVLMNKQFFSSSRDDLATAGDGESRAVVVPGELVAAESSAVGSIQLTVYTTYLRAAGYFLCTLLLVLFFMWNLFMVANNIWLSEWSSDAQRYAQTGQTVPTSQTNYRLAVYGALGAIQAVFMLLSSFFIVFATMRATARLHESMLARVMHAPTSFFDTTPSGRLLNRFSKDVDAVDIQVPRSVRQLLVTLFYVVSFIITISYSTPLFVVAVIPMAVFYGTVQRFYACATRQLRRLESVARSPIYSLFSETVTGQAVIMATMQQQRFIEQNERNIDLTNIAYYPYIQAQRWLNFLLGMLSATIVLSASLLALSQRGDGSNSEIASSMIGLAISNALMITTPLNLVVSSAADVEMSIVSAERIDDYSRNVPQEAAWTSSTPPPPEWPQNGSIKFDHYSTRYRPELDLVLRDLTADIHGGERLGIVGRTGAGKSSLALALFRIIEAANGSIVIDGIDIAQIGLHELRSRLAIIPQDPVLFSGTLRSNLDPTEKHSDAEVWLALEQAHLKHWLVSSAGDLNGGLELVVQEEGQNLSVGQRQLVCLARALLRKSRVLVLDEATAAIDVETDELIQQTIRTEFRDSTVLTVAHRLNTILDYDRVMVLAQGKALELDSPAALLRRLDEDDDIHGENSGRKRPRSEFAKMVRAANIAQDRIDMAVKTKSTDL